MLRELTWRKVVAMAGANLARADFRLMHAFRNSKQRLQRLVWLTLLTWSFALASGVVNACVLSLPGRMAEGASPTAHGEAATPARSSEGIGKHGPEDRRAATDGLHPHEQDPGNSGKDTCLKFCDDESSVLAKSTPSSADTVTALVDGRVDRHLAVARLQADSGPLPEPPRAQGPPLVIRFLRLTL